MSTNFDRRRFLAAASALGLVASPSLAQSIVTVKELGAIADGKTRNTQALQTAIDRAHAAGGGTVVLTPGVYLSGGLRLKSNVTLHLEAGAKLLGSTRVEDYEYHPGPPEEGDANGRHLLFALDAENIAVQGAGTIDGNGAAFWHRKGRETPKPEELWGDVIAWDYEAATSRRPAPMLEFARCRNVRIEGVTLANAPSWTMRPVACDTVLIRGVRVRNPIYAPNTDGMDITASQNVIIADCDIRTGDDAICIKSENPYGDLLPTRNITVTNCILTTCCNGFKLGTRTEGRVENIVFSNSVIANDVTEPLNHRVIAGIALEMVDGGSLDGVAISNIRMENVRTPIFVRLGERTAGKRKSFVRNIRIANVEASGAIQTSSITGLPGMPVEDVSLSDITIRIEEHGRSSWVLSDVPEVREKYPEARMFGRLPASGFYLRHARGISIKDAKLIAASPDARPVIIAEDVEDLVIGGLQSVAPAEGQPVLQLKDVTEAFLTSHRAPCGTAVFLELSGERTKDVSLVGNDLSRAEKAVTYTRGATKLALVHQS